MNKTILLLPALTVLIGGSSARAATEVFGFNALNLAVPDGNPAGLANNQTINSTITTIDSVVVTLNLSGTFNGDIYAYLAHSTGFSVLLNCAGKSASIPFGYNDDGFNVTLDDTAGNDIHTYRNQVTPGIGNPLVGLWQPDGRNVDPDFVTDLSARGAMLSSFNTAGAASGDWTLFVADMSSGDTYILQSWSMSITGQAVPESGTALLAAAGGLLLCLRRRRKG